eukprot:UN24688
MCLPTLQTITSCTPMEDFLKCAKIQGNIFDDPLQLIGKFISIEKKNKTKMQGFVAKHKFVDEIQIHTLICYGKIIEITHWEDEVKSYYEVVKNSDEKLVETYLGREIRFLLNDNCWYEGWVEEYRGNGVF